MDRSSGILVRRSAAASRRPRRGATLIELIVVIAIIGLLAVLGGPNLSQWISRMRLDGATARVQHTISVARKATLAKRVRWCMVFTGDPNFSTTGSDYMIGLTMTEETAPGSATWVAIDGPPEFASWTNDESTDHYPEVSLENGTNSTSFAGTDGCNGLLFNSEGYLDNDLVDFEVACGGANCARLTLRSKGSSYGEQRSLWIDRGGNVRVTSGPATVPSLGL